MSDEIERRLFRACRRRDKQVALSILESEVSGQNRLIRHDDWESTPLHEACRHGWLDVVQLLVEKVNHDVDVTTVKSGQTPLHISCQNGQVDIVRFLTKHGCNPVLRDLKGKEPIDYALESDYTNIVHYLSKHCITSAMMLAPDRIKTSLNIIRKILHDSPRQFELKTSNGDNILETICHSKVIAKCLSPKKVLRLINDIQSSIVHKGDILPYLICRVWSHVSCIPSVVMMEWLGDNRLDLMKLVISCNWWTADGDTLLQLVCKSESCVSRITSTVMLKWLTDTNMSLLKVIAVPNYKTAEGNSLLQLVFQSKSRVSRLSSTDILKWLTDTNHDILKLNLVPNYKTADDDTILTLICQTESCISRISSRVMLKWLTDTNHDLTEINLVSNYKTADGDTILTLICQTESCVSSISSRVMLKWLTDTNHDLMELNLVPNYKTADGDTILTLICQTESCVSSISSIVMLKWLTDTNHNLMELNLVPNYKTADGDTILTLICQTESCVSSISSRVMLKWLTDTNHDLMELNLVPNHKTANGDTLLTLICQTESCVSQLSSVVFKTWLKQTNVDLLLSGINNWKTADGTTIISIVDQLSECEHYLMTYHPSIIPTDIVIIHHWESLDCKVLLFYLSKLCISQTSSKELLRWLQKTNLAPEKIVTPHWKTADGDTLLQLVCQSKSCVSCISSAVMLKWLNETKVALTNLIIPDYKTADGDTLLQLICQSESCISCIYAETLKTWLKSTTIDLYIDNLDWKTSDCVTMIDIIRHLESQPLGKISCGTPIAVVIIPSWENVDGSTSLQILYFYDSHSYISQASSTDMFKWLQKTSLNLDRIVNAVPNWKTANGDTLLQLVCQSKSYVSRTSSTILLKLLTNTPLDQKSINPNFKTADGKTLFQLVCQSKSCVTRISSMVMLKWLTDTTNDLMELIVPTHETADGDTLLQLLCQSESCVSHVSSKMLEYSIKSTNADLLIPSLNWKTTDGVPMIKIIQNVVKPQQLISYTAEYLSESLTDHDAVITPHWETDDGTTVLQVLFKSDLYISQLSSASLSKWLHRTNIDVGKIVVPHWKTADGDTLLQLVCQSESCVSRISSTISPSDGLLNLVFHSEYLISQFTSQVILNWLNSTKFTLVGTIVSSWKTKNGDSIFKLLCTSHYYLLHISSSLMLQWLNDVDNDVDKATFNILKSVHPDWTTNDGDAILHLLCKSSMKEIKVIELLQYYLQHSILDPNLKDSDGNMALHLVCKADNLKCAIVTFFVSIDTKFKVNDKNKEGLSALELTKDPQIMEKLVQHGANVTSDVVFKIILSVDEYKASELLLLSFRKKTMLLKATDVNDDGDTALHLACKVNKPNVVTFLLANMEWNPNVRNSSGLTPLEMTKNPETILCICQYDSVKISSKAVKGWLNTPISIDEKEIVKIFELLTCKHKLKTCDDTTLLHLCCGSVNIFRDTKTLVNILLNQHHDLNYLDKNGQTPLQITSDPLIMEKLVQHGARVTSDVVFKIILSVKEHKASEILLSSTKKTMLLKATDVNDDGDTALHLACRVDKPNVVKFLLSNMEWNLNVRNHSGLSPLETTKNPEIILCICHDDSVEISSKVVKGWLNDTTLIDKEDIVKIFDLLIRNQKLKTCDGSTLLHICCGNVDDVFRDTKTLVNHLLNQHHDPNYLDNNGQTPLQITSDPQIMEMLVQHGANVTSDVVFKIILSVEEHKASEILLSSTKKTMLWKPSDLNDDGDTALHLACKFDKPAVVKYLLKYGNCNAAEKNLRNELPIELTTNIDTIILLTEHGATIPPELVLKLIATEIIPNDLLAQLMWNPNITNSDGNTALHLACQADQQDTVNLLLSQTPCDSNVKNNNDEVPLQMTTNSDIIKDLIRYGAQTSIMYESTRSALGTNEPIKPPVKMFIVGNPSVGKSTLTEALKKTLNFVARWFTSGKVSGVEKKTVGIIPHEIESDIFGRVTVYDFAGHREFYSGHAALLKAAIQSTPPVFLLVVNLLDGESEIIQNILYWISFLENQCTLVSCKPHLIIIGSHADTLKSQGVSPQEKVNTLVSLLDSNYFINLEFIGFIPMDCQLHESTGMNDLRPLLVRSCSQLRIQEPITFNAHCFLVYLLETFKDTPAVTISTIHEKVEKQPSSHSEGVLDFLPRSTGGLYKICVELNERGHILFLRDKKNLENSYIVIEEKSLLSEVSGTVFASEDFKQYKHLASKYYNTGVVSLSKLAECFPGKDMEILIGFLTHLEFCHEISNQALHQIISRKYSPDFGERYYLFPALISLKAKESIWEGKCDFKYHFGWILQCTELEQFFSSRFLQVLLLRLAFIFALESSTEDPCNLGIRRKCLLWKNGIFWGRHFGINMLVEINHNKHVIVMSRFNESNLVKCLEHRSQVLHTVLECVEEFCPRISTVESFIEASSALEYPFELNHERTLCTVKDLAEALVSNCENPSVVFPDGNSKPARSFFSFEPYAEVEASILHELWDNNNDNKLIPNAFLSRLVEISNNIELLIKIFNESAHVPPCCSRNILYQEIVNWRDKSETYKDLRDKLNRPSVFAGRNVLVSMQIFYLRLLFQCCGALFTQTLAGHKVLSSSKSRGKSVAEEESLIPLLFEQGSNLNNLLLIIYFCEER